MLTRQLVNHLLKSGSSHCGGGAFGNRVARRAFSSVVVKAGENSLPSQAPLTEEERAQQEGIENAKQLKALSRITVESPVNSVGEWEEMLEESMDPLPENLAEVALIDQAYDISMKNNAGGDGTRTVQITQNAKVPSQSVTHREKEWIITWFDEVSQNCWDNPLMGWVSSADPMQNMKLQMRFDTKEQAIHFAQKRGWNYEVSEELVREYRDGETEYQDNFLPKIVAKKVARDKTKCNYFERSEAGTSHYFRPLKYHGDGTVPQYGPNGEQVSEPHVEGYYKTR